MLKVIFTVLILFSTSINATDNTPPEESNLECNKLRLQINDHQVELGFVTKSKEVNLKTAELITLTNEKLIYAGEVADSIGDQDAVSEIMGRIMFHNQMFKQVEKDYKTDLDREFELSAEIVRLSMQVVTQECPTDELTNDEILETCNTYDELKENVNCMVVRKPLIPEKKDEPKKAHPKTLEV